jgi:hypothetical protein
MRSRERAAVQVRLTGREFDSLEDWRKGHDKIPPRSEAIREAIRQLVRAAGLPPVVPASYDKHRDST